MEWRCKIPSSTAHTKASNIISAQADARKHSTSRLINMLRITLTINVVYANCITKMKFWLIDVMSGVLHIKAAIWKSLGTL